MEKEKSIKLKIKEILNYYGWEQQELAKRLGISPSQVTRWLSGQYNPHGEAFMQICEMHKKISSEEAV